ncbi:MAG: hypothetical protein AAFN74_13140, partial [Myxococcota bacterium]
MLRPADGLDAPTSTLSIEAPAADAVLNDPLVVVRGTAPEQSSVSVNGMTVPVSSGRFSTTIEFADGTHT